MGKIIALAGDRVDAQLVRRVVLDRDVLQPLVVALSLKETRREVFERFFNESDFREEEKKASLWTGEYSDLVDHFMLLSFLFTELNDEKARQYFTRAITESTIRHGWRKDPLVSYLLIDAFEILWTKNVLPLERLKSLAKDILDLALRVRDITDGKGTARGPYHLIETVTKFDLSFAMELRESVQGKNGFYWGNSCITIFALAMVRLGRRVQEVEKEMEGLRGRHPREPELEVKKERLKVYIAISSSPSYPETVRKEYFEKAYQIVDEAISAKSSDLGNGALRDEVAEFRSLCEKYGREFNVPDEKVSILGNEESDELARKQARAEFLTRLGNSKRKKELRSLFVSLADYQQKIRLSEFSDWDLLVEKSLAIFGNIVPVIDYLKSSYYPNTDFFSANSEYMHFAVAAAIKRPDSRAEMQRYLADRSGHGGCVNIIRAFSELGDKEMCARIFDRFHKVCQFLVN